MGAMTASLDPTTRAKPMVRARKYPLSPRKHWLDKWTAVSPADPEKHGVMTRVVEPGAAANRTAWLQIEAAHARRPSMSLWSGLTGDSRDTHDTDVPGGSRAGHEIAAPRAH
jgi:hypothetical protein